MSDKSDKSSPPRAPSRGRSGKQSDVLSPRAPSSKRKAASPSTSGQSSNPYEVCKNELSWITHTINLEATKKSLKVELIRSFLEHVFVLQMAIRDMVAQNATLEGRLEEARQLPDKFTAHFARVLAERDSILEAKSERVRSEVPCAGTPTTAVVNACTVGPAAAKGVTPMEVVRDYAGAARGQKLGPVKKPKGALTKKREASKSAARKAMLEAKRAEAPGPSYIVKVDLGCTIERARSELWTEVKKQVKDPKFSSVVGRTGKLILKPHNKESADVLKNIAAKGRVVEEHPLWPRVIVSGIPADLTGEEVGQAVMEQNPDLNLAGDASEFKLLFKKGRRDRDITSWVAEVAPSRFSAMSNADIYVGFMRCRSRPFEDVTQCFACLRYGHPAHGCFEAREAGFRTLCAHCAVRGHKASECPSINLPPKCANCGGKHEARDKGCSHRVRALANILSRTNFKN